MKFPSIENNNEQITLSYKDCYAKTETRNEGTSILGATVEQHCIIVGYVAKYLLDSLSENYWSNKLPSNIIFIAALHDIGKVYPSFQYKIYSSCNKYPIGKNHSLQDDKIFGYHTAVGEACFQDINLTISKIIGQHHGYINTNVGSSDAEKYGGKKWQEQRKSLILELSKIFNFELSFEKNNNYDFDLQLALVVISDWIGSSININPNQLEIQSLKMLAKQAVINTNFSKPNPLKNLSFKNIFGFNPREFQEKFINIAKNEGTYILEAPMGSGKTEAALYIAYNQLKNKTGIYFALPTRLTSNNMHSRVFDFINIIDPNNNVYLIHGGNQANSILGDHSNPGSDWFSPKKRSLLGLYGVGTIDQALLSILNVKHHELRKFGLAGKVVIFDEVHTYDAYTSTLLKELIKELHKINSTIIILSATLTKKQSLNLLGINEIELPNPLPYPCCTSVNSNGINCTKLPIVETHNINLSVTEKTKETIDKALDLAYGGQQILWIENTVKEAQEIYKIISARCDSQIEVGLVHSRFTQTTRSINEDYWVNILKKDSFKERVKKGRILIGTQVLEQSLDIDADFLITRLAPIDMIFQRMGRVWRHKILNKYRPKDAICSAIILIEPDLTSKHFQLLKGNTSYVYDRYILYRTLEIIKNSSSEITLPTDIRPLIEKVYEEREESGIYSFYKSELQNEKDRLNSFALSSIKSHGNTLSEDILGTRYSETITTRILLISEILHKNEDNIEIKLLTGKKVTLFLNKSESLKSKTNTAILLENEIVSVNEKMGGIKDPFFLNCLKNYIFINEQNSEYFLVAKVKSDYSISTLEGKSLNYSYNSKIGLYKN